MTRLRLVSLALAAFLLAPTLAAAASSEWFETQGGRVRLIVLPQQPDGRIPALLEVRLEPGWKTYWRDPGASGIPPSVRITQPAGLELESIRFPVPKHFDDGVSRYTGYDRSVVFPLTLRRDEAAADAGAVTASVFLGVCQDICIPVQADLVVDLASSAASNRLEQAIAARAEADLPEAPAPDFMVTKASWGDDGKTLSVTFTAPETAMSAPLRAFVSGPDGFQFDVASAPVREGDTYRVDARLLRKPKAASLAGATIMFTAESGGRSMETPLAID